MDHRGDVVTLDNGWMTGGTTGHKNRRPANRKEAASTPCAQWDCRASSNAAGTCHPITVAVPASQHNTGCMSLAFRSIGIPAKIRGAATVINKRWFNM